VGYGCTTCIGNSGPLPDEVAAEVRERGLVVASVLSGNRNFEGASSRTCAPTTWRRRRWSSPTRWPADERRPHAEPLGTGSDGAPVYLKDIWPTEQEIQETMLRSVDGRAFREQYARVFEGDERWRSLPVPTGDRFAWEGSPPTSASRRSSRTSRGSRPPLTDIRPARVLALLGDSITTDHISPAGSIKADSPAGRT
jgi:aconitate hydratase